MPYMESPADHIRKAEELTARADHKADNPPRGAAMLAENQTIVAELLRRAELHLQLALQITTQAVTALTTPLISETTDAMREARADGGF